MWFVVIIVLCCVALGIKNPVKWYRENSIRGQRKADERAEQEEQLKRKNVENLIRPSVTGDTAEAIELAVQQAMEEFDRYMDGRTITADEVRSFLVSKAKEQEDDAPRRG